jgi:hypothetical protein
MFSEAVATRGPDYAIDELRKDELVGAMPEDEVYRSTVYVFREPPPPGTVVTTETFWSESGKTLAPIVQSYEIRDSQPFLVIENRTASGGNPKKKRTLTWRIKIGDDILAEKTLPLRSVSTLPDRKLENGAYLPSDLQIMPPAPTVPPELAALSGIWHGSWNDDVDGALAFEEIEPSGAVVVALGLDQDVRHFGAKEKVNWFVPHHWIRVEAKVSKNKIIVFERAKDGDDLSFEVIGDGRLRGFFVGENRKKWEATFTKE